MTTKVPVELSSTPGIVDNSNATAITIDSSERVGIGTTSPDTALTISKSTTSTDGTVYPTLKVENTSAGSGNSYARFVLNGGNGTTQFAILNDGRSSDSIVRLRTDTASPIAFLTNGSEAMRIDSSGGVGINTSSITGALTVKELSGQVMRSESTGSGSVVHIQFVKTSGGTAQIGDITGTTSSVAYNSGSDYRLKENVITDWDATTLLKQLKPSKFNFKDNQSETVTGFIAHEVQEVLPYLVSGQKDGENMQSMDYGKLTPLLTKAIQEQQTIIEDLKTRIETLEG